MRNECAFTVCKLDTILKEKSGDGLLQCVIWTKNEACSQKLSSFFNRRHFGIDEHNDDKPLLSEIISKLLLELIFFLSSRIHSITDGWQQQQLLKREKENVSLTFSPKSLRKKERTKIEQTWMSKKFVALSLKSSAWGHLLSRVRIGLSAEPTRARDFGKQEAAGTPSGTPSCWREFDMRMLVAWLKTVAF